MGHEDASAHGWLACAYSGQQEPVRPSTTQAALREGAATDANDASMQEQSSHKRRWPPKHKEIAD